MYHERYLMPAMQVKQVLFLAACVRLSVCPTEQQKQRELLFGN